MSTPPERLGQTAEELRGDLLELAREELIVGAAAGTALLVPLYLDGRAAPPAGLPAPPSMPASGTRGDSGAVLRRLQLVFTAAVALNAANFWTVTLNRYNNGGLVGAIGSFNTSATAVAARVPLDVAAAAFASGVTLNPGDYLELAFVHSGTGAAIPVGTAVLEYARLSM